MSNAIEKLIPAKLLSQLPQSIFNALDPENVEKLVELREFAERTGRNVIIADVPVRAARDIQRNGSRVKAGQTIGHKRYTFGYDQQTLKFIPEKLISSNSPSSERVIGYYLKKGIRTFAEQTYGNVAINPNRVKLHSNFCISDDAENVSAKKNSDNVVFLDTQQGISITNGPDSLFIGDGTVKSPSKITNSSLIASLRSSGLQVDGSRLVIFENSNGVDKGLSVTGGENIYLLNSQDISLLKRCKNIEIRECNGLTLIKVGKSTFIATKDHRYAEGNHFYVVNGTHYSWISRMLGRHNQALKRLEKPEEEPPSIFDSDSDSLIAVPASNK